MITKLKTTPMGVLIGKLRISTDLPLHPEFAKNPDTFAFKHNVNLVGGFLPEVMLENNYESGGKFEKSKENITLVHRDAIRLFVCNDGDGYRIRSIFVNPSELMNRSKRDNRPFNVYTGLELLKENVAPLLANQDDVRHIIPGNAGDDGEHRSNWSEVECTLLLPHYEIACFHGLAHPLTGPAQGSGKKRIELSSEDGCCTIRFNQTHWSGSGSTRLARVDGVAVILSLKGDALAAAFKSKGLTAPVRDAERLVRFSADVIVRGFLDVLRQTAGSYLPVPPEWAAMGKAVTSGKMIALLAEITSIPRDEILAMDAAIRNPCKSTRYILDKGTAAVAASLKPILVSSLFALHE